MLLQGFIVTWFVVVLLTVPATSGNIAYTYYWPFNGTVVELVTKSYPVNIDIAYYGFTSGICGTGLDIGGDRSKNSYLAYSGDTFKLLFNKNYTISLWLTIPYYSPSNSYLIMKQRGVCDYGAYWSLYIMNNFLYFKLGNGTYEDQLNFTLPKASLSQWTNIVIVQAGSSLSLGINGTIVKQITTTVNMPHHGLQMLWIAHEVCANNAPTFYIEQAYMFQSAVAPSSLYSCTPTPTAYVPPSSMPTQALA